MTNDEADPARVAAVLDGTLSYDELHAVEARLVREAWDRRIDELRTSLDLRKEFTAAGRSWSEATADGRLVIRSGAAPTASSRHSRSSCTSATPEPKA